jgi:hypothetical protein
MHKTLVGLAGVLALTAPAAAAGTADATPATETWVMPSQTIHGSDHPIRISASGPIQGAGVLTQDFEMTDDGPVVHAVWHFRDGDVLADATEDYALDFDPVSCTGKATATGSWTITGGTGAYAGATGQGTFSGSGSLVGERDDRGGCLGPDSGADPRISVSTLRGTGVAQLP